MAKFFQDLPMDIQDKIVEGLTMDFKKEGYFEDDVTDKTIMKKIDYYINVNNNPEQVSEWIKLYSVYTNDDEEIESKNKKNISQEEIKCPK